tara:strand:- start:485 stop:895 length:411 start_codon:yes stop_codon:yes gene_type:complete
MNDKTPKKSLLSTLTPEIPPKTLKPQMGRRPREIADGRSLAASNAVDEFSKIIKQMKAQMMAGKGNPAGKDLSLSGKRKEQIDKLKQLLEEKKGSAMPKTVQPAKRGGLMKAKKKKTKKSKTAGRLAKRGYGAAKK